MGQLRQGGTRQGRDTGRRSIERFKADRAEALLAQWDSVNKGDRVTMAKARRDIDPLVVEHHQRHLQSRAYRKMVNTVFDRGERNAHVLSRELSRRISIAPVERRLQWTGA